MIFLASRPILGIKRSKIVRNSDSRGLTLPNRYSTLSLDTTRNRQLSHMHTAAALSPVTMPYTKLSTVRLLPMKFCFSTVTPKW